MGDSSPITTRQAGADRLNPDGMLLRLEAAVSDWASTVVDFGSFALVQIFVEVLAEFGVAITLDETRGPMGLGRWDHIRTLCNGGAIATHFSLAYGRMPTDDDAMAIYNRSVLLQIEKVGAHSAMTPGALDTVVALRKAGLKIGTCPDYPRVVMDRVIDLAVEAGYTPDYVAVRDEVPRARPRPAQTLHYVVDPAVGDVVACVEVDDTVPGAEEGRRAGTWTVALLMSGDAPDLLYEQHIALSADECARHRVAISTGFAAYHLHYEIDTIADLPEAVANINCRPTYGERPQCI